MARILKVQSSTAPPFNPSRNYVRIEIPETMPMLSLRDSAVLLKCRINTTDTAAPTAIHSVSFGSGNTVYPVKCLIKNARLFSDKQGTVEELPHYNILACNLQDYTRTLDDMLSQVVFGNYISVKHRSAFRSLSPTASSEREATLRIPLSSVFGFCHQDAYQSKQQGKLTIELEFEDILGIVTEQRTYDVTHGLACDNASPPTGGVIKSIESTAASFATDRDLTLWAGGKIAVSYKDSAGADQTSEQIIQTVSRTAGNKMVIELVGDLGNTDITDVEVIQVSAKTVDYEISDVALKLVQNLREPAKQSHPIVFRTWTVESVNKAQTTHYERDFELQPGTMNAFFMTPTSTLISEQDSVRDYRIRIDGKDTTSESIVPGSALYQDRLMTTMTHSGSTVKNLHTQGTVFANPTHDGRVMHLTMRHTAPSQSPIVYLFKQVQRGKK